MGLSVNQTLLDNDIEIYSEYLDESEEKFNIPIQNKKKYFDETFYINDKSIIKKYARTTEYTSEQQGKTLSPIMFQQVIVYYVAMKSRCSTNNSSRK